MKKCFFLTGLLFSVTLMTQAQDLTLGIKGGVQANYLPFRIEEGDVNATIDGPTTGFHAGLIADLRMADNFSIQPNLLFMMKGGSFAFTGKTTILSVDIPINLLYRHDNFFVGAGPNFSYGLSGKVDPYDTDEEEIDIYEVDEFSDEAPFKRFEVGANVLMGYSFPNGLILSTQFTPGLTSIINDDIAAEGDAKVNTRVFGISLGYTFGSK